MGKGLVVGRVHLIKFLNLKGMEEIERDMKSEKLCPNYIEERKTIVNND